MSRKKLSTQRLESEIINVFKENYGKILNHKQIYVRLQIDDLPRNADDLLPVLNSLISAGRIEQKGPYKFYLPRPRTLLTGKIDINKSGRIFLAVEGYEEDFIVTHSKVPLLPFDVVEAELIQQGKKKMHAEVIRCLQHADKTFTGVLHLKSKAWLILPDSPKFQMPFSVDYAPHFKEGYKVVFTILDYRKDKHYPLAKVQSVLGPAGEHQTEMHAILAEYGLPSAFSAEVEQEAKLVSEKLSQVDLNEREDFRSTLTFTIDPVTAKDFDDAISYKPLTDGGFELGVHIADVSHYVQPGSLLDQEALKRATSVYLVDRVVPMLPFDLSDVVCSLVPNQDRLCCSVIFNVNSDFVIQSKRFAKTVIHSDKRYSYEEAQAILDQGHGLNYEVINHLNTFAKHLNKLRFEHGAMAFESVEYQFVLNAQNQPIGLKVKQRQDTNKLIEELMLLANKTVAEWAYQIKPRKPFVYRTHDFPSDLKLQELKRFVARFGYNIAIDNDQQIRQSINDLSAKVEGKPEQDVIRNMCVRSMAKAVYTPNKPSHFGLAFEHYTHFTSPIRRYPDILVHRLLFAYLKQQTIQQAFQMTEEQLDLACKQSSKMEILATDAERASIKYKQAEWMETQVGKVFEGVVTGLTDFGIFVEINEFKCEGMVRLNQIQGDRYEFDQYLMVVEGMRYHQQFKLGDAVKVMVMGANKVKRTIDLELILEQRKHEQHGKRHRRY
jgi:ribonuclease R